MQDFSLPGITAPRWTLVDLSGIRLEDGSTVMRTINGATAELTGFGVVITIRDPAGARVLEGTLSDNPNTMTARVTEQIDRGEPKAALPAGASTFDRIAS